MFPVMDLVIAGIFGLAGGFLGGLVGVGGGILFVPGLVIFLDESQVHAEATSLLAIIFVALAGAYRQRGYGNVRVKDAIVIGTLSVAGVALGVVISNAVPERTLEVGFAVLAIAIAAQLVRRVVTSTRPPKRPTPRAPARP